MQNFLKYKNVFIDSASEFSLEQVNEKSYLKSLFRLLEDMFSEKFNSFQFYVLFSRYVGTIPDSNSIQHPNKILLWFSEESGELPVHISDNYKVVFKSYLTAEGQNIFSNPLGYVNEFETIERANQANKDIRLFFAGNLNHNRRELYDMFFFQKFPYLRMLKFLPYSISGLFFNRLGIRNLSIKRKKFVIFFFDGFKRGLDYKTYSNLLSRSQFVLCPRGFISTETFRHAEASSNNCIVISERLPNIRIYEDHPFIQYGSYKELGSILDKISNESLDTKSLAKKNAGFYQKRLHIKAVAQYIFEKCILNQDQSVPYC